MELTIIITNVEKIIPAIPAIKDKTTDSAKICFLMSHGVAPSARRIPISLVRSLTTISIMLIIPITPESKINPPTTNETTFKIVNNPLILEYSAYKSKFPIARSSFGEIVCLVFKSSKILGFRSVIGYPSLAVIAIHPTTSP